MKVPVSVLILTKNEEKDLPGCLQSVAWSDDIHVYDNYSSDQTVSIAHQFGAMVYLKPETDTSRLFGGDEAEYRNWGLRNIPFKYEWVLQLDADERITPELAKEIDNVRTFNSNFVAYNIQRRDFYLDTWLRHVQATPFYIRLYRPKHIHFERLINPVTAVDGAIGKLNQYIDHYPFSKGLSYWIERHNNYSTLEALQIYNNRHEKRKVNLLTLLKSKSFQELRAQQKELFYKLPARPLLKFIILYFIKRGFLDGKAGLSYALLQSFYEFMIVLKVNERKSS